MQRNGHHRIRGNLPATHCKSDDDHPLPLWREVELEHKRDRHGENDKICNDVAYTCNEDEGAIIDAVSSWDCRIPAIGNRGALEDGNESTRNGPKRHENPDG